MNSPNALWRLVWITMIPCAALSCSAPGDWSEEQLELIRLSDAWIEAEVKQDTGALERILDERFVATFASSGRTMDRSAYIAWIVESDLEPFQVLNDTVEIHGDSALVIARSTDRTTRFTWSAVKKDGQWVVVSEIFSRIAEAE